MQPTLIPSHSGREPLHPHTQSLEPTKPQARVQRADVGIADCPSALPLSTLAAATLAACGGGESDKSSEVAASNDQKVDDNGTGTNPTPLPVKPTAPQAARFLMQAAFGGTYAQVEEVMAKGYEPWLDEQLAAPLSDSHYDWIVNSGFLQAGQSSKLGMDNTLWRKLMSAPDVLRQRVAFALSQIFVVSIEGLGAISWRNVAAAAYMDLLEKHAFGNFADLLKAVSLSPAMGTYLNMKGSVAATGNSSPDENYAREVMQLFTIGLYLLNDDGSLKLKNGKPIETYQQQDVTDLAAILTGWNFKGADTFTLSDKAAASTNLKYFNSNMVHDASKYSFTPKNIRANAPNGTYIGGTIPSTATGPDAINIVLDYLANHDNVGPFIGRQLIQRLVCSNPSPAYISRVSAAFKTQVNGKSGDMKTVIKAVLLDTEARNLPTDETAKNGYGKLREPALRLVQWARTFNAKPSDLSLSVTPAAGNSWVGPWNIGDLSDDVTGLGQSPLRSPSVFNFYRPGYIPTQGAMATNKITAPEFQICNEVTVAKYLNFMNACIDIGRKDVVADYSADYALAKDATALVDRYALLLAANALSESTKKAISEAVATQTAETDAKCLLRIKATIFMIMATPEYMVQK